MRIIDHVSQRIAAPFKCNVGKIYANSKKAVRCLSQHSDILRTSCYTLLNTTILVTKIFHKIPKGVGRAAMLTYSYLGLLSLPYQIKDLKKSIADLIVCGKLHQAGPFLICTLKVCSKAVDVSLTTVLFGTSMLGLAGQTAVVLSIYKVIIPIGLSSFVVGVALNVFDAMALQRTRKVINDLTNVQKQKANEQGLRVTRCCIEILNGKVERSADFKLAARLIRRLDSYRMEIFTAKSKQLKKNDIYNEAALHQLFDEIKESIMHETKQNAFDLFLTALGYISRGIYRAYPDTLVQASTTWGVQLLYLIKMIKDKIYNHRLDKRLNGATPVKAA